MCRRQTSADGRSFPSSGLSLAANEPEAPLSTEELIALIGVGAGLAGGLAGPYVSARFATARLERTLEADRRKDLVEQRRKLLDQGALLIVELEEALHSLLEQETDRGDSRESAWADLDKRFKRFGARLELWFDEGSEVVANFRQVLNEIQGRRSFVAGADRADKELQAAMLAEFEKTGRPEVQEQLDQLNKQRWERQKETANHIDEARRAYQRAARAYLAGDVHGNSA